MSLVYEDQAGLLLNRDNGLTLKHRNPMILVDTVKKVRREDDGAVHHDLVIDECKKKQSDNTGYWSHEMKKHFVNA